MTDPYSIYRSKPIAKKDYPEVSVTDLLQLLNRSEELLKDNAPFVLRRVRERRREKLMATDTPGAGAFVMNAQVADAIRKAMESWDAMTPEQQAEAERLGDEYNDQPYSPFIYDIVENWICESTLQMFPKSWWAYGNGCCDCNRSLACGYDDEGPCQSRRFYIVDKDGNPVEGMNDGYPPMPKVKRPKLSVEVTE